MRIHVFASVYTHDDIDVSRAPMLLFSLPNCLLLLRHSMSSELCLIYLFALHSDKDLATGDTTR